MHQYARNYDCTLKTIYAKITIEGKSFPVI